MYDIIFVGQKNKRWNKLKNNYPTAKYAEDFNAAQRKCVSNFFWLVWDNLDVNESFTFDYTPDDWSQDVLHTFLNDGAYDGGIALVPKTAEPLSKEIQHRFFIKDVKQLDIEASKNTAYDIFYIDSYEDYQSALENSSTELFWGISRNLKLEENFDLDFVFRYTNEYDRTANHAFIHRVDNKDFYNGVFLFSKHAEVTKREIDHRFLVARKEWDIVASGPVQYDVFDIHTYDDYQNALKTSTTELFWGKLRPMNILNESVFDIYFNFDNEYDRKQNHAFLHDVKGEQKYDGLYLFSKHTPVTKREIDHKFLVARKEWDIVASTYKPYDQFYIDSYEEYRYALENSSTELFWGISRNLKIADDFDLNMFFDDRTNEFEYDRAANHAFIHRVDGNDYYNGLFLFSTKSPVTKKEIDHRFLVARKEWDTVASGPVQYDKFTIESYDDYERAFNESNTDMFWIIPDTVTPSSDFGFDVYFNFDNEYDKEMNHCFLNGKFYDGIILCSTKNKLTKREIDYGFVVNRKEWDIVASYPKAYDKFTIDTYDDYLTAAEKTTTSHFWAIPSDVDVDFDFNYQSERSDMSVHMFLNGEHRDGISLINKYHTVTENEVDHRYYIDKTEVDIVASVPKSYQRFNVKSYSDYLDAIEKTKYDMFWIVPDDVEVDTEFKFDTYFSHHNTYDRKINHVYLNGKYNDGIILCSKFSKISEREFLFRFLSHKKEVPVLASKPKPYDIVFISYQEPNADENYSQLLQSFPRAKRVHGVKGIHQAHIAAAKLCETPFIWIVDGDAKIVDDFKFDYQVPGWQYDHVHVWRSQNPINDLVYGYGGIKLFPRELTLNMDTSKPDMTTSISEKFKAMPEISNITAFNTDPFNTWKSAFRECCKLSSKIIDRQKDNETNKRLKVWTTVGSDRMYGNYALQGALDGSKYGRENRDNPTALKNINDFDWLKEKFDASDI